MVVTVALPASPNKGDTVRIFDVAKTFDSNSLTIARNGKLMGDASDMTVGAEGAAFDLVPTTIPTVGDSSPSNRRDTRGSDAPLS